MIIVIQCKDRTGLVAAITGVLAAEGLNIISLREHVDKIACRFFLRLELEQDTASQKTINKDKALNEDKAFNEDSPPGKEASGLEERLRPLLPPDAIIVVNPLAEKKIVVLVSKEYHCLADILVRHYFRALGISVQCVIGNHPTLQDICSRFDIPFHQVGHDGMSKDEFEQRIMEIIEGYAPDYLVLAKFMRILSPGFVAKFPMRIINIHHSFLPAFAGASPYRQAFERGVKLIGATAHFVTDELDEGPIIAQQIIPVSHSFTAADMVNAGKEIETAVLAKALRLVFEDRVLVYKNKTIVFE